MKYSNKEFPYDYDIKSLKRQTQEFMDESLKGRDVENIVCSSHAQLGLAEIHKRQLDRSNCISTAIAILALIIALSAIGFQWKISQKPQIVKIETIEKIETKMNLLISNQDKIDSLLFYLKEVSKSDSLTGHKHKLNNK